MTVFIFLAHLAQTGGNKLVPRKPKIGIEQDVKEAKGLAKIPYLFRRAKVNKAMDAGRFGWQVVVDFIASLVPDYQGAKLAF
jgi:hypothetical protein